MHILYIRQPLGRRICFKNSRHLDRNKIYIPYKSFKIMSRLYKDTFNVHPEMIFECLTHVLKCVRNKFPIPKFQFYVRWKHPLLWKIRLILIFSFCETIFYLHRLHFLPNRVHLEYRPSPPKKINNVTIFSSLYTFFPLW